MPPEPSVTIRSTYKDAGVDLERYQESMRRLPRLLRGTHCPRVMHRDGNFAGMFRLDFASPLFARNYVEPVLISCTDGVGTKLKVAQACGRHDTVGIDLVAMSVNDALCCGAEPLFFLDYVAMEKDDPDLLERIVEGIAAGCRDASCALLGGETAIMPDIYREGDYDLAGFCVGVAEKSRLIDGRAIRAGDALIAIASSGLHSNGYSLARRIAFQRAELAPETFVEELGETVGEALLRPTLIYARPLRRVLVEDPEPRRIHGIAHITGGGLQENIARIVPRDVDVLIERSTWSPPALFSWLERLGNVEPLEMARVFNLGVGMALVVAPDAVDSVLGMLREDGQRAWRLGRVVAGSGDVRFEGAFSASRLS